MKQLTKAEEQIMQFIWKLGTPFLREIIEEMPEPRPHQSTVSTVLKVLIEKEVVAVKPFGRMHRYYALVSKEAFTAATMKSFLKSYFDGSYKNVVSFMMKEKGLSIQDLELLLEEAKKSSNKK